MRRLATDRTTSHAHLSPASWRLADATLAALLVLTWAISHRYGGLFHDALLYTLQCAARLNPRSLSQDVFLAFGSQDRFTLFSPVFASLAGPLGIEPAAMALTLVFQVTLVAAAWFTARSIMPARLALLGVLVFVAIPGTYGAEGVFTYLEGFVTPRMAAEALSLASLAAAVRGRRLFSGALLAGAVFLHPLMAAAGVAALLCLRHTSLRLLAAIAAFTLAAFAFGALHRFDADWLQIVQHRVPYLFLGDWTFNDVMRFTTIIVTLLLAARSLPDENARSLCRAVAGAALVGVALTGLACDGAHIVLFTQLQPWRWTWLATAVAALILPLLLLTSWRSASDGRIAAAALAAAWLFGTEIYCAVALVVVCAAATFGKRLNPGHSRLIEYGAWSLLALAALYRFATDLTFTSAYWMEPTLPMWLRRTVSLFNDGCLPVALAGLIYGLAEADGPRNVARRIALGALACGTAAALIVLAPQTAAAWHQREYGADAVARFATWRALIPAGAQVFWPESTPGTWLLLDRAHYLSIAQTSGVVFSRAGAVEMRRRALALQPAIAPRAFMEWTAGNSEMNLSRESLRRACLTRSFEFLATAADLGIPTAALATSMQAGTLRTTRLYDCRADAAASAAAAR